MTRGRPPQKALDEAILIAKTRGVAMKVMQEKNSVADLVIVSGLQGSLVRVKRTLRLYCTPAEIETQFWVSVSCLRSVSVLPGIQRELWIWSRYGTWRFFRVDESGLSELVVMAPGEPPDKKPVPTEIAPAGKPG